VLSENNFNRSGKEELGGGLEKKAKEAITHTHLKRKNILKAEWMKPDIRGNL